MSTLGKSLKVVERERFFDDAFFREAWDDFERAMQSVLDKFDNTGLTVGVKDNGKEYMAIFLVTCHGTVCDILYHRSQKGYKPFQ